MVEEGRSEKLSDQSEILLHCRVDISDCDTDSFMGTEHCNRGPLLFPIPCATSFPSLFLQIMFINTNLVQRILCTETEVCHNQALQKEVIELNPGLLLSKLTSPGNMTVTVHLGCGHFI